MARPRPEPPNRRAVEPSAWWNRWNSESWALLAMPTPVSSISKRTRLKPSGRSWICSLASTWPSLVNFTALPIRLNSAWRSRTGSARIQPSAPAPAARSSRPLSWARGRSMPMTLRRVLVTSSGSGVSSSRPASILEKSITSFSSWASIWPQPWASVSSALAGMERGSFSSRCSTPSTPFIGVRISWLILARNWDLASLAASAARWASIKASSCFLRSSMFITRPTTLFSDPSASR